MKRGNKIILLTFGDILFDQRLQKSIRSLEQAGYEIIVFARKLFPESPDRNIHALRYRPLFSRGVMAYLEYNVRAFLKLVFSRHHVVVSFDLDTLPAAIAASYLKRLVVIHDAHEFFVESPELVLRSKVRAIWERIACFCIPKVDRAYTVGNAIAQAMQEKYGIPFEVIRNVPMVGEENEMKGEGSEIKFPKPYIIYQGALNTGRGLEQIIQVMKHFPDINLVLAGRGDIELYLKEMAVSQTLSNIYFVGNLRPDELKIWTKKAIFGLNLLENMGKSYFLSLANKFFDYIEAGIPQICIDFPEYRTLNSRYDVAILVESCDEHLLLEGFNILLKDTEVYQRLKSNTAIAIRELNWELESEKLVRLYNSWLSM